MILSRSELADRIIAGGVPPVTVNFFGARLNGDMFGTVSREWVEDVFAAGMKALRENAPELVEIRQIGGGKTRLVPKYVLNGFNCRGHHLFIYSHGMIGFALKGAAARVSSDALAFGFLEYSAQPRADNLFREGPHQQLWFVDHAGEFQTFEGGDGEENEFTPAELASIRFLYAQ